MDNEPYRELSHSHAIDVLAHAFRGECCAVHQERVVPSGRRADLLLEHLTGEIHIIEVKTRLTASLMGVAWAKYRHWCTHLWVATTETLWPTPSPMWFPAEWREQLEAIGIYRVTWEGVRVLRPATAGRMTKENHARLWSLLHPPCNGAGSRL